MSAFQEDQLSFQIPVRAILTNKDMELFQKSKSCLDILDFIKLCAESVVNSKVSDIDHNTYSSVIINFEGWMKKLYNIIDDVPPIKQPMRFGNKAFKTWHDKMKIETDSFLVNILPNDLIEAKIELAPYIYEMFGNTTRIDYGTGHELNFIILFYMLYSLKLVTQSDCKVIILKGFTGYIRLMRRLQTEYMLEPAGSHGVWGLDDYHCLLFLFGSAQLSGQTEYTPISIHEDNVLNEFSNEYIYFEGIKFIKTIKSSAPFAETSPMLNDISGMHNWAKVCSGLMRLFQGEVLHKFPVVQHLLFGTIFKASWIVDKKSSDNNIIEEVK